MSEKQYATASGHIQFDPATRDLNGKTLRDIVIRAAGSQKNVRITVWPDHADVALAKGDWVSADGAFEVREHDGKTFNNLSAYFLTVVPQVPRSGAPAASSTTPAADAPAPF